MRREFFNKLSVSLLFIVLDEMCRLCFLVLINPIKETLFFQLLHQQWNSAKLLLGKMVDAAGEFTKQLLNIFVIYCDRWDTKTVFYNSFHNKSNKRNYITLSLKLSREIGKLLNANVFFFMFYVSNSAK